MNENQRKPRLGRNEHPHGIVTYELMKPAGKGMADGRPEWVISWNQQWVPGCYDTEAAALAAIVLPDAMLQTLNKINDVEGQNRPITLADIQAVQ